VNEPIICASLQREYFVNSNKSFGSNSLVWVGLAWLAGIVLFLLGRYGATRDIYWHFDDWAVRSFLSSVEGWSDSFRQLFPQPFRPLGRLTAFMEYRWVGDQPARFLYFGISGFAILSALYISAAWLLTRSRRAVFLFALFFAVWPNFTETFHWPMLMSGMAYGSDVFYALTILFWVLFIRDGKLYLWLASVIAFLLAAGGNELGYALPAALCILAVPQSIHKLALWMTPYALILGVLLIVRFTNAFGHGVLGLHAGAVYQNIGFDLATVRWNLGEYWSWWFGSNMLQSITNGWSALFSLGGRAVRPLLVINGLMASGVCLALLYARKGDAGDDASAAGGGSRRGFIRTLCFVILFWLMISLPISVSFAVPRMMVMPGFAVSLGLAMVLSRVRVDYWVGLCGLWIFMALGANQGTALAWRETGQYADRLMGHVERLTASIPEKNKYTVILETRALAERLNTSLNQNAYRPVPGAFSKPNTTVFMHRWIVWQMINLSEHGSGAVKKLLVDVENGPHVDGNVVHWHERYQPDRLASTPAESVIYFDVFSGNIRSATIQ
jgi:hypothetical protein